MKAMVLAVGMMVIFGSSSVLASTRSDYTKSFPLQTLKTFEFKDQHRISRDPLANNAIWANDVKDALRKDLAGHGYAEATAGQPDFYIAFYVGLQDRYDASVMDYRVPVFRHRGWWGWPGGSDVWWIPYTQSTLIIDVIDAKTNQLVWRGYDSDALNSGNSEKTLDSAVDHIVSRLAHDTRKHVEA